MDTSELPAARQETRKGRIIHSPLRFGFHY